MKSESQIKAEIWRGFWARLQVLVKLGKSDPSEIPTIEQTEKLRDRAQPQWLNTNLSAPPGL